MKVAWILIVALTLILQDGPLFVVGIWPGEGKPIFRAKGIHLTIRETPAQQSDVIRLVLNPAPGTVIEYDETQYQTISPGKLVALVADSIYGRKMGDIRVLTREEYYGSRNPHSYLSFAVGDTIDYLQYRAEGWSFIRVDSNIWEAELYLGKDKFQVINEKFQIISEAETEWWIRVIEGGSVQGWLLVADTLMSVNRTFR